jgi:hypothetical protein
MAVRARVLAELVLTVLSLVAVGFTFQNAVVLLYGWPLLAGCSNSTHCTRGIVLLIGLIVVVIAAPVLLVGSWRVKKRPFQFVFVVASLLIAVVPSIAAAIIESRLSAVLII